MKNLFILSLLVLWQINVSAQSHVWNWAETAVQPNNSSGGATFVGVTSDAQGNVLVTGYFYNNSVTLGNYTLHNADGSGNTSDILTAKYDPNGNVLWAKSAGGTGHDDAFIVNTDKWGNVYITGYFNSDSISFDNTVLYNHTTGDTFDDIFVAKYSSTGALLWAKSFGGDSYDAGQGVATDTQGNVYLAGNYQSDSVAFGPYVLYNTGVENAFLAKCDSSGNVLWATGSASNHIVAGYALSVDLSGNAFIAGRFTGATADFGTQEVDNQQASYEDIYLVKYDPSGNALWAQSAGGSLNDRALALVNDAAGNVFVTGYFNSNTAYFGPQQLTNDTTSGTSDVFTAKYDGSGNLQWVNGGYGNANDVGQSMTIDTAGNVYITGFYYSEILLFGNDTLRNFDAAVNTDDMFMVKYSNDGNLLNALSIGNLSYDCGNSITTDAAENVYVAGFFRSDEIVFGDTTLFSSSPNNFLNPFLAKYSCVDPATPTIAQFNDTLQSSALSNNQWYMNGIAIAGAIGQKYVAALPGTYTVEVINGPLCKATSAGVTTGINNLLQLPAISLYPNPANDLIIAESASFSTAHVTATVYDITGKIVQPHYNLQTNTISFDLHELSAGMYWLKFNIDGKEATAKFVKVDR